MKQRSICVFFLLAALPLAVFATQNPAAPDLRTNEPGRRQTAPGDPLPPRSNAEVQLDPAFSDGEKSYLEGKISARQFQKLIRDLRTAVPKVITNLPPPVHLVTTPLIVPPKAAPPPPAVPVPTAVPLRKPETDDGSEFDLEGKLNELLQKKAERARSTETNITPAELVAPGTALTKRQRLDLLLRLFVQEKIPQAEYQATRAKIMALPD